MKLLKRRTVLVVHIFHDLNKWERQRKKFIVSVIAGKSILVNISLAGKHKTCRAICIDYAA